MEQHAGFRLPKVLAILLGIVVFLALLTPFVSTSYGLDGRFHLYWIEQFTKFNSEGVLFPRWIPSSFWGFGSAAFYFYPPLTYYVASLIHVLSGISTPTALFQIISFLASIGSFFAARMLLKAIGSTGTPLNVGSALYMIAPLRFAELYHRGDLSTHLSYVFIPIVWYALIQMFRTNGPSRLRRIVVLALSATLLLLTSIPVAMVTAVCACAAGIAVWKAWRWDIIVDVLAAALLALGLSAFHLLAAISAMPYTWLDLPNYHLPFSFPSSIWPINLLAAYELPLVYIPVLLIVIGYGMMRRSHESFTQTERIVGRAGLGVLLLILFLDCPPLSRNLWNHLEPLQIIGLPWRLYSQFLLGICMVAGIARSKQLQRAARASTWVLALGAIVPAVLAVSSQHLFAHFTRPLEDAYEYRPIYTEWRFDFVPRMPTHAQDPVAIAGFVPGEHIDSVPSRPNHQDFDVSLQTPRRVTFHRFYWPYWILYIADKKIESSPDTIGRAVAVLPAGNYQARWRLERSPLERAGFWISGIAWVAVIIFWGIGFIMQRVRNKHLAITP